MAYLGWHRHTVSNCVKFPIMKKRKFILPAEVKVCILTAVVLSLITFIFYIIIEL